MALSGKPKAMSPDAFLAGGGTASKPQRLGDLPPPPSHPLKFARDRVLLDRLDAARNSLPVHLPRNTWILQAIAEKLEREGF